MKNTFTSLYLASIVIGASLLLNACRDMDNDSIVPMGDQQASVYITDDPGFFDHVLINIQSVAVLVDSCTTGNGNHPVWEQMSIVPRVYDLLALRNGEDTLLAREIIPAGNISMIRIILGTNNSVVKNNVSYPLNIDSTTIDINTQGYSWYSSGVRSNKLWLDVDIFKSIVQSHQNNQYYLHPVVKIFSVGTTGSIAGQITPMGASPVVTIFNATDTAYALPDVDGNFEVRGLDPGSYNLTVNASNGYIDTTISNIQVTAHMSAYTGNIIIHQ